MLQLDAKELHRAEAKRKQKDRISKLNINEKETLRHEAVIKKNKRVNLKMKINRKIRLQKFKRAVLFGPIFVCSCCHVKHFESNVTLLDNELESKLLSKYPDCFADCVRCFVKVMINEKINYYLCKTCLGYMRSAKSHQCLSVMDWMWFK